MMYELAMMARNISEISNWFHNINSNKPLEISRQDIVLMEEKATRVQEFIISLRECLGETEKVEQ